MGNGELFNAKKAAPFEGVQPFDHQHVTLRSFHFNSSLALAPSQLVGSNWERTPLVARKRVGRPGA